MTTLLAPPETETATPAAQAPPVPRHMWAGFSAILAAMVLNILDSTIVNVAAPAIQADLSMTTSSLEWVAAAYTLALAVGLMAGARLGDMFGRKRMLLLGLAGFVVSSALCSFAWSADVLVASRALQGLTAAVLVPQSFGMIRDVFPPHQIGKAFAAMGPAIGLSTVLGPVVAGLLMKLDLFGSDWRALFLINLPIGVLALLLGMRVLPDGGPSHRGLRLDVGSEPRSLGLPGDERVHDARVRALHVGSSLPLRRHDRAAGEIAS